MKDNKKIYINKKGYDQIIARINDLRREKNIIGKYLSSARQESLGWRNFEYQDASNRELIITGQINGLQEMLSRVVIIEDNVTEREEINIGDVVRLRMKYNDEEEEEGVYRLVASAFRNLNSDIEEITLNSPLGMSLYGKEVGFSYTYNLDNGNVMNYTIIEKVYTDGIIR